MEPIVVKVQLSFFSPSQQETGPCLLVSNKDRTISWEEASNDPEFEGFLRQQPGIRAYFYASVREDGGIHLEGPAPAQDW